MDPVATFESVVRLCVWFQSEVDENVNQTELKEMQAFIVRMLPLLDDLDKDRLGKAKDVLANLCSNLEIAQSMQKEYGTGWKLAKFWMLPTRISQRVKDHYKKVRQSFVEVSIACDFQSHNMQQILMNIPVESDSGKTKDDDCDAWEIPRNEIDIQLTGNGSPKTELGSGSFGIVGLGRYTVTYNGITSQKDVAVKMPMLNKLSAARKDPKNVERFKQEVLLISKLRHVNICECHGCVTSTESDGLLMWIVMEKLDMDLDEAIREQKVPIGRQNPQIYADIMRGIVSALAYLHFRVRGNPVVVHRDLKPKNVMLDGNNVPKLIDFGLAKETEGGVGSTFQKIGTDEWMAPEQKSNGGCSTASDMYALGMIGHFVLQGLTPNKVKELRVHVSGNEQADLTQRLMIACCHEVADIRPHAASVLAQLSRPLHPKMPDGVTYGGGDVLNSPQVRKGRMCRYYQSGTCKFGKKCRNVHAKAGEDRELPGTAASPSTPSTPFSPASSGCTGPRKSWGSFSSSSSKMEFISDEQARNFWMSSFCDAESVEWNLFSKALKDEVSFELEDASLTKIRNEIPMSHEGMVTVIEFNVFTRKLGFEVSCRKAAGVTEAEEAGPPVQIRSGTGNAVHDSPPPQPPQPQPPHTTADQGAPTAPKFSAVMKHAQSGVFDDNMWNEVSFLFQSMPVDYMGKGAFLGGQKTRKGTMLALKNNHRGKMRISLALFKGQERQDECKFLEDVQKITSKKENTNDMSFAMGSVSTLTTFPTQKMRDDWAQKFDCLQRLLVEGDDREKQHFALSSSSIQFCGQTQAIFLGVNSQRQPSGNDRAFVVANEKLDAENTYFQVQALSYPNFAIGLVDGADSTRKGLPGWNAGEVGFHGDDGDDGSFFTGTGKGRKYGKVWSVGDSVGCGLMIKGTTSYVYFIHNGDVVFVRPHFGGTHPIVAVCNGAAIVGELARVDISLRAASTHVTAVERFMSMISVHGHGVETAYFGDFSDAYKAAKPGQTISLSPGAYIVAETITIDKNVSIIGSGTGTTTVCAGKSCDVYMFRVQSGEGKVSFQNLTLQGGVHLVIHKTDVDLQDCKLVYNGDDDGKSKHSCVVSVSGNLTCGGCEFLGSGVGIYFNHFLQVGLKVRFSDSVGVIQRICDDEPMAEVRWDGCQHSLLCKDDELEPVDPIWSSQTSSRDLQHVIKSSNFIHCATGIHLAQPSLMSSVSVENCAILDMELGIQCSNRSSLLLRESSILDSSFGSKKREQSENCTGLYMCRGSQAKVVGCTFSGHYEAIMLRDADSKLTGKDTTVTLCQGSGVYARGKVVVKLDFFKLSQCGLGSLEGKLVAAGVLATDGAIVNITGCEFTDCRTSALHSTDGGTLVHDDCKFTECVVKEDARKGGRIHKA